MPHCMVPKCTNGWRETKGSDMTYHRVPAQVTISFPEPAILGKETKALG